MNLPVSAATTLAEGFRKALAVLIILEDRLTPVAAVHDMIDRALKLNAKLACHAVRTGIPP